MEYVTEPQPRNSLNRNQSIDAFQNVIIIVTIMSKYTATVIKTGNSYALRVPKKYVEDARLELGQKTTIQLPVPEPKQDRKRIQKLLTQLQELNAYADIKDPTVWQRDIRRDRPLPERQ